MKKVLVFSIIVILSIVYILSQDKLNIGDNVYVVSKSEAKNKETAQVKEDNEKEIVNEDINKKEKSSITIHISGEVIKPGVVTIEEDKRLSDAVEMLGGTTSEADLNRVNLAIKLNDEEHYIIPKIGENIDIQNNESDNNQVVNNEQNNNSSNKENKKININNSTIQELEALPGVGEATANKILKYREENSKFKSIEEIKNVNGIGDKKYESIKDLICVD